MNVTRKHDNFFKTTFEKPAHAAELLRIAAKHNDGLAEFLDAVNLDTLQPMPGEATREGLSGATDLAFRVNLKGSACSAELHVGVVLEHKSYKDTSVLQQLMHYYFEVILQKAGNIPTVAIVVYNGNDQWNPLKDPNYNRPYPEYPDYFNRVGYPFVCEFIDVGTEIEAADFMTADPQLVLALVAMRYAFQPSERSRFLEALRAFKKLGRKGALDFIKEVYVYLKKVIPLEDKEKFMDTEEAYANKGYKSIYDAELEDARAEGLAEGRKEGRAKGREEGREEREKLAAEIAAQAEEIRKLKVLLAQRG